MTETASPALEAAGWLERSRAKDFAGWADLTAWLEASPANARAYGRLAALEDALVDDYSAVPLAPTRDRRRPRWWQVAAVAALIAGTTGWLVWAPHEQVIEAGSERRTVVLASGDRAVLAPGARLAVPAGPVRSARVVAGEVFFVVRHDPAAPFAVTLPGGQKVTDLGTRFTVMGDGDGARVAVSEGLVRYTGGGSAISVTAGQSLVAKGGRATIRPIAPDAVADWADAPLAFDSVRLEEVAARLSLATGLRLKAAPAVANRRVTATLFVDGRQRAEPQRIAAILGLVATKDGEGWVFTPS